MNEDDDGGGGKVPGIAQRNKCITDNAERRRSAEVTPSILCVFNFALVHSTELKEDFALSNLKKRTPKTPQTGRR